MALSKETIARLLEAEAELAEAVDRLHDLIRANDVYCGHVIGRSTDLQYSRGTAEWNARTKEARAFLAKLEARDA